MSAAIRRSTFARPFQRRTKMKSLRFLTLLARGTAMVAAALVGAAGAQAQSATTMSPYTLTVFPGTPPAGATQPDDLAVSADGKRLWVGYGNGVDTFGKGGPSNVVEYDIATGGREARLIDGGCPVGGRRFRPGNFFK